MTINVPTIHVAVKIEYITNFSEYGIIEGYLVAARCRPSEPLLFSVHLANGALYSGLPINAISHIEQAQQHSKEETSVEEAQPWSCLDGPASAVELSYLRNYDVQINAPGLKSGGRYLFTIDYAGTGLASDPQQYKMHHIIAQDEGCLVAMPNNYLLFKDKHFTGGENLSTASLRRNEIYYRTY